MKNVLLIAFVALLLTACRKEYCWQCETAITTLVVSPVRDTTTINSAKSDMLCDRTEKEIRDDEEANSTETVTQEGSTTVYRKLKMTCKK